MLITFLLLALLTVGAVSASDDAASDNMTVRDDTLADSEYTSDHGIEINEDEICIDENDEENYDEEDVIAEILLPGDAKGSFQIHNGEQIVGRQDFKSEDEDDSWEIDENGDLYGSIYLKDFALSKVKDGDELCFKFVNKNNIPDDRFTKYCKVTLTRSTLLLTEIGGSDVDIQVNDINTTLGEANFTYLSVAQRQGVFIISVETDDDFYEIFKENLNTTTRPYTEFDDENGNHFYRFAFSLNDLNAYIAENINYADSFKNMTDSKIISSGDEMYFDLYEDDEETEIYSISKFIDITPDGMILFKEDEDVDVDYGDLEIVMSEGWQEREILDFIIRKGITGKIVIYLNDTETPVFEKSLSQLTPVADGDDDTLNHYYITVSDLNITQPGSYIIREYFIDDEGKNNYQYDEEDPEVLVLYEAQNITVDNVTIEVNPNPTTIDGNDTFITVSCDAAADEVLVIYVDGNENPVEIRLEDCRKDSEGNYLIGSREFNLQAGQHNLNITYKSQNLTATVNLLSNLLIELPQADEIIYTTFSDSFVFISLEEGEIFGCDGIVNLTIKDSNGNVIAYHEWVIIELLFDEDVYVIRTGDVNAELNGTYTVIVGYFNGTQAATQVEGSVFFKSFDPKQYGAELAEIIKDENDYLITFTNLPLENTVFVEIDGNSTAFEKSDLEKSFDSQKKVYAIKYNMLKGYEDGVHSVSAYIDSNKAGRINLTSGKITFDLKQNTDPGLEISVSNITEGSAVIVVISTNASFTGDVMVRVGNANYTVNVVKGYGSLKITGLKPNTYAATAVFTSDAIFNESVKTAMFKVNSKPSAPVKKPNVIKLTLKKVKIKKSAKKLVIKATLKINGKAVKGKKITFKFKGKTYKVKTKKGGVAKLVIKKKVLKKLKVGKKVTYTAKYSTKKVKKTVKVKK